jgi:hypothetical protein
VSDREGSNVTVPKGGGGWINDQSAQRLRHCFILSSNVSAYLRTEYYRNSVTAVKVYAG